MICFSKSNATRDLFLHIEHLLFRIYDIYLYQYIDLDMRRHIYMTYSTDELLHTLRTAREAIGLSQRDLSAGSEYRRATFPTSRAAAPI